MIHSILFEYSFFSQNLIKLQFVANLHFSGQKSSWRRSCFWCHNWNDFVSSWEVWIYECRWCENYEYFAFQDCMKWTVWAWKISWTSFFAVFRTVRICLPRAWYVFFCSMNLKFCYWGKWTVVISHLIYTL